MHLCGRNRSFVCSVEVGGTRRTEDLPASGIETMPSPLTAKETKRKFFSLLHRSSLKRSDQDVRFIASHLLEQFHFFRQIPEKAVLGLAQVIVPRHVHVNEAIYVEDALADSVSFIYSGRVVVHCKHHGDEEHKSLPHANKIERMYGRELHRLGAGDMCGESSLLSRISRASNADSSRHQHITSDQIPTTGEYFESYIAHRDIVTLLTIVTSDFLAFLYPHKKHICWHPNRCIDILKMAPSLRKRDDLNVLLSFVSQVGFFKQLSRPNQLSLCSVMNLRSIEKGDLLFKQGDDGTSFFIILSGHVSVHVYSNNKDTGCTSNVQSKSVENESDSSDKIDKTSKDGNNEKEAYEKKKNMIMRTLTPIGKKFFDMNFDELYGHAVAELREGDSFGEQALQGKSKRNATICCRSEQLQLIVISRDQYNAIIAPRSSAIVTNIESAKAALDKEPSTRTAEDVDTLKRIVAPLVSFLFFNFYLLPIPNIFLR